MKTSPSFVLGLILTVSLVVPACESSQRPTAPEIPNVALARVSGCEVFGGGIDTHAELVATDRDNRAAMTIEPITTQCEEPQNGIWFRVYSYLDDGTTTGRRILLGSDHNPVVLRQNSSGTETAWTVNIDFVPPAEPFKLVAGFFPPLLVEVYGPGGKMGEITDVLNDIPEPGHKGPRLHD